MKKKYNPKDIEESIYYIWKKNGYFIPTKNVKKNNFCIIMPPPNITGSLHMGHAFQHTIMDILIRYHRMRGDNTLWQMGLDHAGIATQLIVSKKIKLEENITLDTIERHAFIQKCWDWKRLSHSNINYQIQRLGNSVDWSRERFTLDPVISHTVQKIFIDLYNKNLIYRKKKLSHWDIELKTVISDLELEHRIISGNMWYIKYPILNSLNMYGKKRYLKIATTRPETLLGDTAIAVNPLDIRYKDMIGKYVVVPIVNRVIPIISDKYADIDKGTGCVKITPAHDFNDYAVALRHKLPLINIFTYSGNICNNFDVYDIFGNISYIYSSSVPIVLQGLDRLLARKKILYIMKYMGLLDKTLLEQITVSYGDRSGSIIEPMLTNQWYLRVDSLSKTAIAVVENDTIQFIPKQYKNMYLSWMNNIQDWCISRQLWWGHRIPAWYDVLGRIYVGKNEKSVRKKYLIPDNQLLKQDEDVLDTWFSSSLWTFLSLDWPNKKNLLKMFHPTTVLVSGFDIIFFWIARMIMMTMYFIKDHDGRPQIPFKTVYITGLIRDEQGKKMSKSKGNVLDPLDIIDGISLSELLKKRMSYTIKENILNKIDYCTKKQFPHGIKSFGTDALRFTFSALSSTTRNINWDMNRLQGYRNFCNKIWNAGQFILLYVNTIEMSIINHKQCFLFFDHWILIELNNTICDYRDALDTYRFDIAANKLHNFIWHKFCDWYLEIVKIILRVGSVIEIKNTKYTVIHVFESLLRLAHPIIPFITEKIWQNIKHIMGITEETIMLQNFPVCDINISNDIIKNTMMWIQDLILFIRNIRISLNMDHKTLVSLFVRPISIQLQDILLSNQFIIQQIACIEKITILSSIDNDITNSISGIIHNSKVFIVITKKINFQVVLLQLEKKIHLLNIQINKCKTILLNDNFINKAPPKIIIQQKNRLNILLSMHKKLIIQKLSLEMHSTQSKSK